MKKKKTNENVFDAGKRFTDAFFDGLKRNAVNKALIAAKKNPELPVPIVNKMIQLDKLAKEFEAMLDNEQFFKKHR